MEKKALIICASAGFLGLLSAALAFAAEATRIKVSDVQTILGTCVYPRRSPAVALGLLSAVALVIAQVIINSVACHMCCNHPNPSDTNWRKGLISFIASWGSLVAALVFLLSGAALNDRWGQEKMYFGELCYIVKFGVFSGGALLSLTSDQQLSQVIPFGDDPHTPPAFLHEDTLKLQPVEMKHV
ncbi:uncharacterized protein LOC122018004 isoform X2 [Zingiber officinale]|uniref:uncharacterized protein LOC122018004 isoform X2 n=1 Tax=Zingiber officinale TaxID=94328 RepID=UPI001C4B967C|nr:uncharacterized protein LOC122018004 isoform X2 [Zingiber officinale]